MCNHPLGLFITGTSTDVGKTYVTALIARSLREAGQRVGVYKPVASGCREENGQRLADDAIELWEAAGRPRTLDDVCPQRFLAPLAPHLAAAGEGLEIDAALLRDGLKPWLRESDIVLIEGAGGLMSPLGDQEYVADLAYDFGFPLLVVAPNMLGVINQTLQTLITAATFREGLDITGIVLNDVTHSGRTNHCSPVNGGTSQDMDSATDESKEVDISRGSNLNELRMRCVPPVVAHVGWGDETFSNTIDWLSLARPGSYGM